MKEALTFAQKGLIDREALVELIALAAVAGEHLLVVGPPGTAKSEAVRRVAQSLGGRYFEYLLGRFTEPSEIFGPVDLKRLKDGVVETQTSGMLPEADLAFLDEVFLGSTAILNTLLGILNERRFRRGHTILSCPLRVCVGATNALPEDETLAAFADRFLVRFFVEPIPDNELEDLLEGGWSLHRQELKPIGIEHVDSLAAAARAADLGPVRSSLAHALRTLKKNGVVVSDRRAVRIQRLLAAAAVMAGRSTASEEDLWPLVYAVPNQSGQRVARECLRDLLQRASNPALSAAAAEAALGPAARATRLANVGRVLLGERPSDAGDSRAFDAWKLKLEGVAREIDAGFSEAGLPPELSEVRRQIVAIVGTPETLRLELS